MLQANGRSVDSVAARDELHVAALVEAVPLTRSTPLRVRIAAIGVDSGLMDLGLRADGSPFSVTRVAQYPTDQFPTNPVYGNIDHAGLRRITCGGSFNSQTGHYEDNIVVFADLIATTR